MARERTPFRNQSKAEREVTLIDGLREPPMACPTCETKVMVNDMPRHLESCPGPREPHPLSRWITRASAIRLGMPSATLARAIKAGEVRMQKIRGVRRYLERDVVKLLALVSRRRRAR